MEGRGVRHEGGQRGLPLDAVGLAIFAIMSVTRANHSPLWCKVYMDARAVAILVPCRYGFAAALRWARASYLARCTRRSPPSSASRCACSCASTLPEPHV